MFLCTCTTCETLCHVGQMWLDISISMPSYAVMTTRNQVITCRLFDESSADMTLSWLHNFSLETRPLRPNSLPPCLRPQTHTQSNPHRRVYHPHCGTEVPFREPVSWGKKPLLSHFLMWSSVTFSVRCRDGGIKHASSGFGKSNCLFGVVL